MKRKYFVIRKSVGCGRALPGGPGQVSGPSQDTQTAPTMLIITQSLALKLTATNSSV